MLLVKRATSFKYVHLEEIKWSINLVYTMTETIHNSISVSTWKKMFEKSQKTDHIGIPCNRCLV